ncbi:hypothetical protein AMECASPLE_006832 [Ameca splendens]|uniref:Uncharacterized protein n=1 Tax=Ameca splendens TaxID=208324 RepID=A0ABV0XZD3_9TELE
MSTDPIIQHLPDGATHTKMMTVRKKIKGREPVVDPNPHHNHQLLLSHHHLPMCQVGVAVLKPKWSSATTGAKMG